MKKGVKFILAFLALALVVSLFSLGNKPQSPDGKTAQEEARTQEKARLDAWQAYNADPVVKGREAVRKLLAVEGEFIDPIGSDITMMTIFLQSGGKSPLDAHSLGQAAVALDDRTKAYDNFRVPLGLPEDLSVTLDKARLNLRDSARAGMEAFLELQRLTEGKKGSLQLVNDKMRESTRLREQGNIALHYASTLLQSLPTPEKPKE